VNVARLALIALVLGAACGKHASEPATGSASAAPPIDAAPVAAAPDAAGPPTGPIVIDRVSVRTDDAVLDANTLAGALRDSMLNTDAFVGADHAGAPAKVEVTLAATVRAADAGKHQPPVAVVAAEVDLHWLSGIASVDEPAPHAHLAIERALAGAAAAHPDDAVRALATDVMTAAGRDLAAREHERLLPVTALGPLLASADEQQVTWALDLAGAHKARALVKDITPLVKRPPPVRDAAIAALVAIGDPSAVSAIAGAVDFDDREQLTTAIEAAIALGGPDADDFLEMIATGHHDSDLASRAKEGLERIARRNPDAGAPAP
jgi:hypothetical protein